MVRRTHARTLWLTASFLFLLILAPTIALAAPAVQRVVSRVSHAGTFYDIAMPQSGAGGIECRGIASLPAANIATTIVVSFDATLTGGTAAVTGGVATIGTVNFSGSDMFIPLKGVGNAQTVTLTLSNVTDNQGNTLESASVFFRVLEGDVNGSGAVTVGDVNLAKFRQGTATSYATFRDDVDLNGSIAAADTTLVKARINTSVGGPAVNTPPTISNIPDQSTATGTAATPIPVTIGDAESAPATLFVSATSSDTTLIPTMTVTGTGATRTLNIAPSATGTGTATITVTVSDGVLVTTDSFLLTVGSPNKLYVTVMGPEDPGTKTPGTGTAVMQVDAAETQATLRFSYANMTSNKTGAHVHGPADPGQMGPIIFDMDTATPQPDGSFLWTFAPSGNLTVQDIRDALHAGRLYINIHSANYPVGELRGHFNFAAGSTTFTPPQPPPALPGGPPTDADASRFLTQATFGLSPDDTTDPSQVNHTMAAVKQMGYDAWLTQEFATPTTSMKSIIEDRIAQPLPLYPLTASNITEVWWYLALKSPDQLRQRIAYAYSEIFVVSKMDETINAEVLGLASYHDTLANDAFGNFRTLLKDVTLHPIMGWYLNMLGNKKPTSPNFTPPNENYAREVLQLFSIGLNQMHPDGTLKLDAQGLPIPTYDQTTIQNFAHVFTGWSNTGPLYTYSYWDTSLLPQPALNTTGTTRYVNPMVVNPSNHSNNTKTLLNGTVLTGLPSYTTATANADLDAAIDNIFNHPNVGPFICRRLIQHMVTSNPSPGYVYRVSEAFRNNGQGVRGDMKAVIKAILTDYEARTTDLLGNEGYGRLKEPLLRTSQLVRAFHPVSNGATPGQQFFRLASTDTEFLQTPYKANSVFNFFDPDYVVSLQVINTKLNTPYIETIRSPVMEITNENSVINYANFIKQGLIDSAGAFSTQSDVRLTLTYEQSLATTSSSTNLINYLDRMLMAGKMSANTRTVLNTYYTSLANTDSVKRTRGLIYLIATSPQYQVQK